ncbi:hypothetical protein [Paenibacillus odorifer]|uniref:Methionyl-tRNA formyltransferase n=1 Tax=Paenibacillus odorifer TaxID=189426 RepID=A0A1R0Y5P3_9BACL|nr:hypothetical protein [Paenibacillus odorifer]OMD42663.1 hypothetical protein BSK52_07635 [Paenibacillus odorifer]
MALIRSLTKITRNSRLQIEAESTYNILIQNGKKFIQINTYGSKERVHTNVVSQTIQLDEQSARQLFEIIKSEFSL